MEMLARTRWEMINQLTAAGEGRSQEIASDGG
jgi:hypothetical protein